ncbi:class I SAM-dependent methyltransferase, partial [Patescibacteria group bacterium]|nr:class I SAM-dependent methyltransferase [Patescibacteria group bacterium]
IFYNRPWSNYDKSQQAGRVYRPGLKHDIFIDTLTTGPFERGMAEYVDSKERVIEKMLKGIPLSELERDLIKTDEVRVSDDIELSDISLGEIRHLDEYQSAPQKLNRYLAAAKRIGSEERFREVFVESELGEQYARYYALCSDKGYQPNNNRLVANLIQEELKAEGKKPAQVAVLDLASGPRMLRRYSPEGLKTQVVSEDILRGHFSEEDIGKNAFVGSFKETKWPSHTFEFVTLLEAFHQTGYIPSRGNFERVGVLSEINRVLEIGGKAYINILYSLGLKDKDLFEKAVGELGYKVIDGQTGQYSSGQNFETTLIVLEKINDLPAINLGDQERPKPRPDIQSLVEVLKEKGLIEGLKLEVSKKHLGDTNIIMDTVELPSGAKMQLTLTESDQRIKAIREKLQSDAEKLVIGNLRISSIPKEDLEKSHFKRCLLGGKYALYHKMPGDAGYFIYRQ